jgi:hypothetical protein
MRSRLAICRRIVESALSRDPISISSDRRTSRAVLSRDQRLSGRSPVSDTDRGAASPIAEIGAPSLDPLSAMM